jgi:uncharacterized protein (TIGR02646 family)
VIAIQKSAAPATLVRSGEAHARELCAAYDADPELYRSGKVKMPIRRSIYTSDAVKAELEASHHGKCCYCETSIPKPYAHSHVEHWRPKASSRQGRHQDSIFPGYYWLAYSWDNLLLSCTFCNSSNKGDLFPLDDPTARARHHGMPLEEETPSILKPDGDKNPRDHITFHFELPVGLTSLGSKTIEVLGLDSPAHELRLRRLREIGLSIEISMNLMKSVDPVARQYAERFRDFVNKAVGPEQPYSAMVAAYLGTHPLPDSPS